MSLLKPARQNSAFGCGCLWLITLLWNGFLINWLSVLSLPAPGPVSIGFGLFAIPFVLIGLFLLGVSIMATVGVIGKRLKLGPIRMQVSKPELRPGETFSLSVAQPFKGGVEVAGTTIRLLLRESATYQRGTDTTTVTHDHVIESVDHPGRRFERGQIFQDERSLTIPATAMHSFAARRNKLQWFITVKLQLKGWPDVVEEFELRVLPLAPVQEYDAFSSNYN